MPKIRKVDTRKQTRIFDDDFFKVDEVVVAHENADGSMSREERRVVFVRGDSAAVLLFNLDTKCVVLVNHFKVPTLGKGLEGGWVVETVVGNVELYETPESAAARETLKETGYKIDRLSLIAKFFPVPCGASECVHLFYAEVKNADKVGEGGGDEVRDIRVLQIPLDELLQMVKSNRIEDPKLLIGALWLKEELKGEASRSLDYSSVKYGLRKRPDRFVGYKTGPISEVKNVSIWVNSENEDMIMDRFIGRSISANIRYLGADKDSAGNLTEDIVNDHLINQIGPRSPVRIGTVIDTKPGSLSHTHGVDRIFHVATVRGVGAGQGVKADVDDLARCVQNVLIEADKRNRQLWWLKRYQAIARFFGIQHSDSILIPMIGGGDGGLQIEHIVPKLFSAAVKYYQDNPTSTLKEVYFLAYTAGQKSACDREIDRLRAKEII
jgi:nudix-type nucleoside diphosphatase (YffH/AdpP family)